MPLHILPTSHRITITIACPCTPSHLHIPSPSYIRPPILHAAALTVARPCTPLHTLLPSHAIALAHPLTLAISRLGPCRDWPPGAHRVRVKQVAPKLNRTMERLSIKPNAMRCASGAMGCASGDGNACGVEMNLQSRHTRLGGQIVNS